jgi:phosphonate transport system permease protein
LAIIIHTTGVLGRLFTDAFENCAPISSRTLRVNGCSFFQGFIYGKFFQLTPQIISYVLYRWENNIRVASILGIVGAGGLGQLLTFHLGLFLMDKAATVIIATMILIVIVDGLSSTIRRSLN